MDGDLVTFVEERSARLRERMIHFLRDLIAIPSPGCGEEAAVKRVGMEMKDLGFDSVNHDVLGNVVGTLGTGPIEVLYDAHLDTRNVGNIQAWAFDPTSFLVPYQVPSRLHRPQQFDGEQWVSTRVLE